MKVSIIIPIYNIERYLSACLDSVLAQTFRDWDAFLVDDGSTDRSSLICDEYADKDSRFHVIHQDNAGAANAKNTGLDHADGDYVAFIDSDDYVSPQWLERLVSTAEEEQTDIVEYQFDKVYLSHTDPGDLWKECWHSTTAEQYLAQYFTSWSCSLFCNKLFRRDVIGKIRFRKERRCIDDEFFTYKVLSDAKKVVRIPDVLYHYRQRASSAVSSEKNQLQITEDALEILIERFEWISHRFPALKKIYLRHDIDIMFFFIGFRYQEKTAEIFHRTARYYLKQSLRCFPDIRTWINVCRLQMVKDSELFAAPIAANTVKNLSDYFE